MLCVGTSKALGRDIPTPGVISAATNISFCSASVASRKGDGRVNLVTNSPGATPGVRGTSAALAGDIANVGCCGDDPYFGGKQMAVLAR